MNLKETKKFALASTIGAEIVISSKPRPFGPVFTYQGIVESIKGINGNLYQVFFTNGKSAYLTWSTSVNLV